MMELETLLEVGNKEQLRLEILWEDRKSKPPEETEYANLEKLMKFKTTHTHTEGDSWLKGKEHMLEDLFLLKDIIIITIFQGMLRVKLLIVFQS